MDEKKAFLWYESIKDIKLKDKNMLIKYYKSPLNIFLNIKKISKDIKGINIELKNKLYKYSSKKYIENITKIEKYMKNNNISYITINEEKYPEKLKNIYNAPNVLFYIGNIDLLNTVCLGIVGSRNCSEYGRKVSYKFSRIISNSDVTIVSGLAKGIDTYAHKGALADRKNTIAVLGCGIDICYPKCNKDLKVFIENNGLVVSEFFPKVEPKPYYFPMRNRIISGLSNGVLVVEAAEKSGSLITAYEALNQDRDVYAIPGRINDKLSIGTNKLISEGAMMVNTPIDILQQYGINYIKNV